MNEIITIKDVAKKAGVAPATVSHTLNGKRPVSQSTRKKVLEAIDTLGYVPSWNASRMKSSHNGIIGCLALDITETFVSRIIKGIESGMGEGEYSLLIVSAVEFDGDIEKAYSFLKSHNVDGLFFCHHIMIGEDQNFLDKVEPFCPIVSINTKINNVTSIVGDDYSGGVQAAEHLLSRGCQKLAIICGPEDRMSAINRFQGFRDRLNGDENVFSSKDICFGGYTAKQGYEEAIKLLERNKDIDGIFCENDYIAAGAINAIMDKGYRVPEDIKILGFDNRDFSTFWRPPISTFSTPLEEMGMMGIYRMKDIISKKTSIKNDTITLQSKLIPRKSSAGNFNHNN